MTSEEYLRVCGWIGPERDECDDYPWTHPRRRMVDGEPKLFDLTDAVEVQVAEDRARLEFIAARAADLADEKG